MQNYFNEVTRLTGLESQPEDDNWTSQYIAAAYARGETVLECALYLGIPLS